MTGRMRRAVAGLGCATLLLLVAVAVWQFRTPLSVYWDAFRGVAAATAGPGRPSADALRSAQRKHAEMSQVSGPESVLISAAEMASLIESGLDPVGREALDSIEVTFAVDRFIMNAVLVTAVWGKRELGMLGAILQDFEPLYVAGPARIRRRGVLAWTPDAFSVRGLPFPASAIPPLVERLTGDPDGAILIAVPRTVRDVTITPEGVTFSRRDP